MRALFRWLKRRRWPKEIRHLPEPESLSLAHWMGASWTERGIQQLRTWRLILATLDELVASSARILGHVTPPSASSSASPAETLAQRAESPGGCGKSTPSTPGAGPHSGASG
jgi:hypothetical protein